MKKMVWMAFVAVMMMLGVESMAQPVQRGEWRRGMTPEQMAERQTMRLSKELALSKKQADKIYKLQLKQLRRMMAMRGRMQAVEGHREPMPSEMLKARRERTEAYRKILSPMQVAKWQQLEQSYAKSIVRKCIIRGCVPRQKRAAQWVVIAPTQEKRMVSGGN